MQKLPALILLVSFSAQQILSAPLSASPDIQNSKNFPLQRGGILGRVSLPQEFGSLEEVYSGKKDHLVILVQDAHAIPDAQKNIQKIVEHFQSEYGVRLIGLEGASGRLDPTLFRAFPNAQILRKVFEEYLDRGELSGGAVAAILNQPEADFYGIEDPKLYEECIGAFLKSLAAEPRISRKLGRFNRKLSRLKRKYHSSELLELDQRLVDLEKRQNLTEFLTWAGGSSAPDILGRFPRISAVLSQIQSKPAAFEEKFKSEIQMLAGKIKYEIQSQAALKEFQGKFQDYSIQKSSPADFGAFLVEFAEKQGIRISLSSESRRRVSRQVLLREMKGSEFSKEFDQFVAASKEKLFQNPKQRKIDSVSRGLSLLHKLNQKKLTHEEWEELSKFQPTQIASLLPVARNDVIARRQSRRSNLDSEVEAMFLNLRKEFPQSLRFYETAQKRDRAFLKRLTELMDEKNQRVSLLVAGGFHTHGLTSLLKREEISYILISPAVRNLPEKIPYLEYMQGQVSWREYFRAKNGRIDLYEAFARAVRDKLLESSKLEVRSWKEKTYSNFEPPTSNLLLKAWRGQIIRTLAAEGRLDRSSEYTSFIDRLISSEGNFEERRRKWLAKVNTFTHGLRELRSHNQLTAENVVKLTQPRSELFSRHNAQFAAAVGSFVPGFSVPVFKAEPRLRSEIRSLQVKEEEAQERLAESAVPNVLSPRAALKPRSDHKLPWKLRLFKPIVRALYYLLVRLWVRIELSEEDIKKLPENQFILAGNHISLLDLVIGFEIHRRTGRLVLFLGRPDSLFERFLIWLGAALQLEPKAPESLTHEEKEIRIQRNADKISNLVSGGKSIGIFPSGEVKVFAKDTLTGPKNQKTGKVSPWRDTVARAAIQVNREIKDEAEVIKLVPVALSGNMIYGGKRKWKRWRRAIWTWIKSGGRQKPLAVRISILEPLDPRGQTPEELMAALTSKIADKLEGKEINGKAFKKESPAAAREELGIRTAVFGRSELRNEQNVFNLQEKTLQYLEELSVNFDPRFHSRALLLLEKLKEIPLDHWMPNEKAELEGILEEAKKAYTWALGWLRKSSYYDSLKGHPPVLLSMEGVISAVEQGTGRNLSSFHGGLGVLFGEWIRAIAYLGGVTTLDPSSEAPEFLVFIPDYQQGVQRSQLNIFGYPKKKQHYVQRPQDYGTDYFRDPKHPEQPLEVQIPLNRENDLGKRAIYVRFRTISVGKIQIIMPSTDFEKNKSMKDRRIFYELYSGNPSSLERFKQEWVAGLAAYEFRRILGIPAGPVHLNETATFPFLIGMIRGYMEELLTPYFDKQFSYYRKSLSPEDAARRASQEALEWAYEDALELTGAKLIFFTHTLVGAGIDRFFDAEAPIGHYINEYFQQSADPAIRAAGGVVAQWMIHGVPNAGQDRKGPMFRNTHQEEFLPLKFIVQLAYRFNGTVAAVSQLNAVEARKFFIQQGIFQDGEIPPNWIIGITNGVDHLFWMIKKFIKTMRWDEPDLKDRRPEAILDPSDPQAWESIELFQRKDNVPLDFRLGAKPEFSNEELIRELAAHKKLAIEMIRETVRQQYIREATDIMTRQDAKTSTYEELARLHAHRVRWARWIGMQNLTDEQISEEEWVTRWGNLPLEQQRPYQEKLNQGKLMHLLNPDEVLDVWARRVVEYKRLFFTVFGEHLPRVEERIKHIVNQDPTVPKPVNFKDLDRIIDEMLKERAFDRFVDLVINRRIQFVFAGKTFSEDGRSYVALLSRLIERLSEIHPQIQDRVVFLEDYNEMKSQYLVRGADHWLNTPERPLEASGTSGMKTAQPDTYSSPDGDGWGASGIEDGLNGSKKVIPYVNQDHPKEWHKSGGPMDRRPEDLKASGKSAEQYYLEEEAKNYYQMLQEAASRYYSPDKAEWLRLVRRWIYFTAMAYDIRREFTGGIVPIFSRGARESREEKGILKLYTDAILEAKMARQRISQRRDIDINLQQDQKEGEQRSEIREFLAQALREAKMEEFVVPKGTRSEVRQVAASVLDVLADQREFELPLELATQVSRIAQFGDDLAYAIQTEAKNPKYVLDGEAAFRLRNPDYGKSLEVAALNQIKQTVSVTENYLKIHPHGKINFSFVFPVLKSRSKVRQQLLKYIGMIQGLKEQMWEKYPRAKIEGNLGILMSAEGKKLPALAGFVRAVESSGVAKVITSSGELELLLLQNENALVYGLEEAGFSLEQFDRERNQSRIVASETDLEAVFPFAAEIAESFAPDEMKATAETLRKVPELYPEGVVTFNGTSLSITRKAVEFIYQKYRSESRLAQMA